jgi:hypothetical protein
MNLEIGLQLDRTPLVIDLGALHLLIAGLSGQGKSSLLRVITAQLAQRPDVQIAAIDPKRIEFRHWGPRLAASWRTEGEHGPGLARLVRVMDERWDHLEANDLNDWPVTVATPRLVVIVDEASMVLDDATRVGHVRALLERGRQAGISVILATQRAAADVIPTQVRDLCGARIAFATANADSTRMILGDFTDEAPAHELPRGQGEAGRCWAFSEGMTAPTLARCYWCAPELVRSIAAKTARHRRALFDTDEPPAEVLVGAGVIVDTTAVEVPVRPTVPFVAPSRLGLTFPPPTLETRALPAPVAVLELAPDERLVLEIIVREQPIRSNEIVRLAGIAERRVRAARQGLFSSGLIIDTAFGWMPS